MGVRFSLAFVCLFFFHTISQKLITKLDIQMFHDESWKPIYFGVGRPKFQGHESPKHCLVGLCTVVSAGFFLLKVTGTRTGEPV